MAITLSKAPAGVARSEDVWGFKRIHLFQVTFDSSYPTGGEVLGLKAAGVPNPSAARFFMSQRAPLTVGYHFAYDRANDKLVVFWADGTAVAAAAFPEVANTTDLSALVVDMLVIED